MMYEPGEYEEILSISDVDNRHSCVTLQYGWLLRVTNAARNAQYLCGVFLQTGAESQYFKVLENSDLKTLNHFILITFESSQLSNVKTLS